MEELTISICGNPNSGKTTLFNALTGARQKTGNWPGVTVEKKEGIFESNGKRVKVLDLPGIYSLSTYSLDERIARDFLITGKPDLNIIIIDATNLERNLYLVIELLEMGVNCILALNMMDMVRKRGTKIGTKKLSNVLGIPVVPIVATKKEGIGELVQSIFHSQGKDIPPLKINYGGVMEEAIDKISEMIDRVRPSQCDVPSRWMAIKLLEADPQVRSWVEEISGSKEVISAAQKEASKLEKQIGEDIETYLIERRYGFISGLVKECVSKPKTIGEKLSFSDKIDKIVINKWLGIPLFLLFMWVTFKLVFGLGNPIADQIDALFGYLGEGAKKALGENWFSSLISNGIIAGIGSVLVFLPNIMLLFFVIGFLEDCGYMARAAFVMDRLMHVLGLHGKSFIPMMLGFGCNIPGIMACRTLESEKDRLLTILINPFMSCSARLPIYVLFAGTFFPKHAGTVIFILYALGIVIAICTAIIFKNIFFKVEGAPLIMELPPYRMPTLKTVLINMWNRSAMFLKKAGTIIFGGVCLIWLLSSMPPGVKYASSKSWIGYLGNFFAPIFRPAGFGFWQAAVALIFGVLAKEIVVGALGTLYGVEEEGLSKILPKYFTKLSAFSFMVMSLLYVPCIASIGVIKSETNSWRWTSLAVCWSLFVGWVSAILFYQIGRMFV